MIRLTPNTDKAPLSIESLRVLIEDVFSSVEIDLDEGESEKATHIATLERIGAPPELIQERTALEAAMVTIEEPSAGEEGYISFLYFPGEEIIIGFSGPTHEKQGGSIAARLASEIGYELSHG